MTGFAFAESETSDVTVRALERFGLKRRNATLMSDGASAYALASQVCEMNQVLCVQHYRAGIVAGRTGMPIQLGDDYMRDCNPRQKHRARGPLPNEPGNLSRLRMIQRGERTINRGSVQAAIIATEVPGHSEVPAAIGLQVQKPASETPTKPY